MSADGGPLYPIWMSGERSMLPCNEPAFRSVPVRITSPIALARSLGIILAEMARAVLP